MLIGESTSRRRSPSTRGASLAALAGLVLAMSLVVAACGSSRPSGGGTGSSIRTTTTFHPNIPTSRATTTTAITTTTADTTTSSDAPTTSTSSSTTPSSSTTTTAPTTTVATTSTTTTPTTSSTTTPAPTTTSPGTSSGISAGTWALIALAGLLLVAAIVVAVLLVRRRHHAVWQQEVRGLLSETADLRAATRAVVNAPGGHAVVELDRLASEASGLHDRLAAAAAHGDPAEEHALSALALAASGCGRSLSTMVQNLVPGSLPTPTDLAPLDAASTSLGAALDQLPPSLATLTHPAAVDRP